MSIGEQLRSARQERGFSLEDIARLTYIRVNHLEAIERGDYSSIPASRLQYFIKDFARHVGLNPDALVGDLPDTSAPLPSPPVPEKTKLPRPNISIPKPKRKEEAKREDRTTDEKSSSASIPVSSPPAVSGEPKRRRPRYRPIDQGNPVLARALIMVAAALLVGLGIYYIAGGFDDSSESTSNVIANDTASPTRILSRPDGLEDSEGEEVPVGDSVVLEGRFVDRVWYNIKMDDQREDEGILDSGEVRTWKASEKFAVSLGNAGGVEFKLNGKSIGALAPLGKSIRGKIITAEGVEGVGGASAPTQTQPTQSAQTSQPRRRSTSTRKNNRSQEKSSDGGIQRPKPAQTEPRNVVEPD